MPKVYDCRLQHASHIYHYLTRDLPMPGLLGLVEEEPTLPLPRPTQPDELPLPEPKPTVVERVIEPPRFPPINLNQVPSQMEVTVAGWRKQAI